MLLFSELINLFFYINWNKKIELDHNWNPKNDKFKEKISNFILQRF